MATSRKAIEEYCEALSSDPSPLLQSLERETHLKTLAPQMISGKLQGQFLRFLSLLIRPRKALEVGTFTGYGALCLAAGLPPDGVLHTLEANPELRYIIEKYIREAGLENRVRLHIGDAIAQIPLIEGRFDMVFIDAAKPDYPKYYDAVIDKVPPGGIILADNVLWGGKVLQPGKDGDARALHDFNLKVKADQRVEQLILPLRDGLMLARKLSDQNMLR